MSRASGFLCVLLAGTAPVVAQVYVFEEDFEDPNWMDGWVIRGDLGFPNLDEDNVVQFPAGDGLLGFDEVQGLAFDSNTGTLYGSDTAADQLITIATPSGPGIVVGALGFDNVQGLAYDPNTGTLYGSDIATDQLITIDTGTGEGTAVGTLGLGFDDVQGLGFDPASNTLYGSDTATGQLITIDTTTGVGTAVGAIGFTGVKGLTYDPNEGKLYGSDTATDQLITISTLTGVGTAVLKNGSPNPMTFDDVAGLSFDPSAFEADHPSTNRLYGSDDATDQVVRVRTSTGSAWVDLLGPNTDGNGTSAGGITFAAPPPHAGGDNERILIDYEMEVNPGEYYFEVQLDEYLFWVDPAQAWGLGLEFYIGDSADAVPGGMDYGAWPHNNQPTGPWKGDGWGDSNGTRLLTQWNGTCTDDGGTPCPCADGCLNHGEAGWPFYVGYWRNGRTFTETVDGYDTILTGGTVVFRISHRMKDDRTPRQSIAVDNLKITLTSVCPDPFADADRDGDVDQDDFGAFQACYTGDGDLGGVFDQQACGCFDRDFDQDVDQTDLAVFEACASGPGVPAQPDCDDTG